MLITILTVLQYVFYLGILAILGYLGFIMASFKNKVPYVPTPSRIIAMMVEMAQILPHEKICDLGSGTGRIIIRVAKRYKKNLIVGIEKSSLLRFVTKLRLLFHPRLNKRIQIINQDFFNMEIFDYDVVFCFLTSAALRELTPKFRSLKAGSRVVSYMFPIEDNSGFREEVRRVSENDNIYLYKKI